MKSRLIINAILVVLLIVLGVIIALKPNSKNTAPSALVAINSHDIKTISIKRKDNDSLHFSLENGHWVIDQPIQAPALLGKIERLLKIAQIKPPVSYPLKGISLENFGLLDPKVSLQFNSSSLNIGLSESVHSRRYVSDHQQLYLLDDTFLHHLTAPLSAYIDTRLFPNNIQIARLQTPLLDLQQKPDHSWVNKQAPTDELSADPIQILFDEWRFARAIKVIPQLKEVTGKPIIITLSNQKRLEFTLIQGEKNMTLISSKNKLAYTFSRHKYRKMTTLTVLNPNDA